MGKVGTKESAANRRLREALKDSEQIISTMTYGMSMTDEEMDMVSRFRSLDSLDRNIFYLYSQYGTKAAELLQISGTYLYQRINKIKKIISQK